MRGVLMNLGYLSCLKRFPIPNFLQEFINDWPVAYLGNFWMYELVSDTLTATDCADIGTV